MLEKLFGFDRKVTRVRTEILAGITTFLTMAYILAVNPNILSATGMDKGALFTTTVIASAFTTLLMAFMQIAFWTGSRNGTECVFCLYGLSYAGLLMAVCADGCTVGGNYLYFADYYKSA